MNFYPKTNSKIVVKPGEPQAKSERNPREPEES